MCKKWIVIALFAIVIPSIDTTIVLAQTEWNRYADSVSPITKRYSLSGSTPYPDVIICIIENDPRSFRENSGLSAFSFGTTSTNIGGAPALWIPDTNEHPVIAQNVYRWKNDRFEQIGQSWLKHAFSVLSLSQCGICQNPGVTTLLGVGCSDSYSANLNGDQDNLGPRSEVNAYTGAFLYPFGGPKLTGDDVERRVQIRDEDIDPAKNLGALYFVEGQLVTADDAQVGNGNNNASYRRVDFESDDQGRITAIINFNTPLTRVGEPGLMAWKEMDPSVNITEIQVPEDGLFILGVKVRELDDGFWAYEYALQNMNSHRSCRAFSVPLPGGATIRSVGFHDIDHHSGEPYHLTDWPSIVDNQTITWSTEAYHIDQNANALRWGTLYNFRFETNQPPGANTITLELFRPGLPGSVAVASIGPLAGIVDCNGNGIADDIDLANGTSNDCDNNGFLDECDPAPEARSMRKNRFISFGLSISGRQTAMRVTFADLPLTFASLNGQSMWIGPPVKISEHSATSAPERSPLSPTFWVSTLECEPFVTDWSQYDVIHVNHEFVVPDGLYTLQSIAGSCSMDQEANFSLPLNISTSRWGDVLGDCFTGQCSPPDGTVGIVTDVTSMLDKFKNQLGAPSKARCDIEPAQLDFVINISDVAMAVDAFKGFTYPFELATDTPCP